MNKLILGSLITLLTTSAVAENVINSQTNTWKSIPITVDADNHTYTTGDGFLMPEGDYYYTYSGYRCLNDKAPTAAGEPITLNPQKTDGKVIYCYPDK